jgi:hypothetical protein
MLTLTSDLTSGFELNFRYARGEDNHPQAVQAVLTIVKGGEECVYKQWAHCHPNDNFSNQYGRKLALTRLLKEFNI